MPTRKILYSLHTLPENTRIAIYGSGKIGRGFKCRIEEQRSDLRVTCFIDTFKGGSSGGIEIIPLGALENHKEKFDTIIVASSLWNQIEDALRDLGVDHFVISNELMYDTLDIRSLGSFRFAEQERASVKERVKRILDFFEEEDRANFELFADLRTADDESAMFDFLKTAGQKYKTPYLDFLDKNFHGNAILEGGVSDGTDSVRFYDFFNRPELSVYGFEPFIETFESSPNRAALIKMGMKIFPWALWETDKDLVFNKNEFSASTSSVVRIDGVDPTENTAVKGVKIDTFVLDNQIDSVNLFKLDIEGAEMEALAGAKQMIRKHKPQLTICIYHKKEHLYEIPELLRELHPGYTFKLGFYSPTFIDTVLYALP